MSASSPESRLGLRDGMFVAGLLLAACGAGLIYTPAGLIVAGLILMALAVVGARAESPARGRR